MKITQSLPTCIWRGLEITLIVVLFAAQSSTQTSSVAGLSHPRIIQPINDAEVVLLPNSTPRILKNALDKGRMDPNKRLEHLALILKASPDQEQSLQTLLDQQQDKASAKYHQWLTPDQFGAQFGVAAEDLQQITNWLGNHGLEVERVGAGSRSLRISGSVLQIESVFKTEMHYFSHNGELHFSNATDITIPKSISKVVAGPSLNDFYPRSRRRANSQSENTIASPANPIGNLTTRAGTRFLSPGDFAMVYNTLPLLRAGITGQGQTIAVLGTSNAVQANDPSVQRFRQFFLPTFPGNNLTAIAAPNCPAPGPVDVKEAYLDVELAGAVAPQSTVEYVASTNLFCAAEYVVSQNIASIISLSFSTCELDLGSTGFTFVQHLWQQAAAQGTTAFVSAGDAGSAGCDDFNNEQKAGGGYAVNGLASTPYNVAVGGTQFFENGNDSLYWNPTNFTIQNPILPNASALGYIPEHVWKQSGIVAGGGGISQCYAKPSWQTGTGIPQADPVELPPLTSTCPAVNTQRRYLPDVSLDAAQSEGYAICTPDHACSVTATGDLDFDIGDGTSAATPSFAGIQALINQQYGRQGQANYVYYQLANQQSPAVCDASKIGGPAPSCVFHDVTIGTNAVPCTPNSPDCVSGTLANYAAGPSYDLASGLGSVDANQLFHNWPNASPRATALQLQIINSSSPVASPGQPVIFTAALTVPDNAWGLPPTGTVALFDGATQLGVPATLMLDESNAQYAAAFTASFSVSGTHTIQARYSDSSGNYLGSSSALFALTIQKSPAPAILTGLAINPSSISSGQSATITATLSGPAPSSGAQVVLLSSSPSVFPASATINVGPGQSTGASAPVIPGSVATATSATVQGSYNGSSQAATVTINPSSTTPVAISLTASQTSINPGQTVTLTATLSGAIGSAPTGTLSFFDTFNGTASFLGNAALSAGLSGGQYVATSSDQITVAGLHAITAIYNGDAHYSSAISNVANITAQQSQPGPVIASLTINPSTIVGGFIPQGVVTLTGPAPAGAFVTVSSNNLPFAQVPTAPLAITQGATTRAFDIITFFTSGTQGATITANYNNTIAGAALTVLPVGISGVSFSPASVTAGTQPTLTVFLTGPAAAGTLVSLVSSNPAVLQIPSTVQPTTGATSISVTATTSAVSAQTTVSVTATYNLNSGQGSLVVTPAPPITLNSFSFSPQEITGGGSISGIVFLTAPAPAGGATVSISSSSTSLVPSTTAVVPAESVSAPFTLTSAAVGAVVNVSITASYGGASQLATLTLVPPLPFLSSLSLNPATVNSGLPATGTLTLTAPAPVGGATILLTQDASFSISGIPFSVTIPEGSTSVNFNVNTSPIHFIARVKITGSFHNGTPVAAFLTVVPAGTPTAPSAVSVDPATLVGGTQSIGTVQLTTPAPSTGLTVTLVSDSASASVLSPITIPAGATSGEFSISTLPVSAISTATITASSNGISQSSLLTLKPAGAISPESAVPFLSASVAPVSQPPGANGFSFTVPGSGFLPGAKVLLNNNPLVTTFVSSSLLQATAPETFGQNNVSGTVTVTNPGPSTASNPLPLHITFPTSSPVFTSSTIPLSGQPLAVATADFNGDGKLDLVVGKGDGSGVSVLLGNGDGTFGPERLLTAIESISVVVADFNGDGKPDIAAITGTTIEIFLGNGDGTFTSAPTLSIASGLGNPTLIAGDFDGDGNIDLVASGSPGVWVILGNGDGTFRPANNYGNMSSPVSIVAADFNRDGKLDLAVSDLFNQSVSILLGNGDGTFQPQQSFSTNGFVQSIVAADFNGDGFTDIAAANNGPVGSSGSGVAILLGNGNGTFRPAVNYFAGQNFSFVATDDMNGDGKLDLLVVPSIFGSQDILMLGNGDGTFSNTPIPFGAPTTITPLFIADLNGDGSPDILVADDQTGRLPILLQAIAPVFAVTLQTLSFDVTAGAAPPANIPVFLTNTGSGALAWTATPSAPWITVDQTSGTAPSQLLIGVQPGGLAPRNYTGLVSLASAGASNSPANIAVSLTVEAPPIVVQALSFNATSITGAGTAAGTITLNSPAPAGGAVISVISNNPAVQVPATIAVPGGSTTASLIAMVSAVSTTTIVTVTATYNQISAIAQLTLIPAVPTADLSNTSVSFAPQQTGLSSAPIAVTLSNNGNAPLALTSLALTGINAGDFVETNTCGVSLAAGSNCTVTITFMPAASGSRAAAVSISDSVGTQTIALSGTGLAPMVSLSTASLSFTNQPVGVNSAAQGITLQNTGTAPLPITSITLSGTNAGDFSQTNNCGTSLLAGTSCVVNVAFTPASIGSKSASVILNDSLGVQTVTLTGTGVAAFAALSPTSVTFSNQPLGTASTAQVISLSNAGNLALSVTSISVTGVNSSDFAQTNNCGASVAAGSSCVINVTFTPTVAGSRGAALTVVDSVGTQVTTLNGIGTAAAVNLSSTSLTFAAQAIGTSSTAQAVTLTNSGNGSLTISAISIGGMNATDFTQTNTCGTGVPAGASCTLSITFIPAATGTRSAAVTIADNAGTQTISLVGTGFMNGPAVQLIPASLSFDNQGVNTVSSARIITVVNTGSVALSITSITLTGTNRTNFAQTNTCGTSVAIGTTCTISVTFTPSAAGPRTAAVTLKDGAGTQTVALNGTGIAALTVAPASIAFGNQPLGSTGTAHTVTITNNTGVLINIASIGITGANNGDFLQTSSTCGATLPFQSSCTINLVFAPTAAGASTAALTITDDAINSPQSVTLNGTGTQPVTLSPASLSFTARVGATSASKNVTIKNTLPTALTISSITISGTNAGDFHQSATTCGQTLAAGTSCTVSITFTPGAAGSRSVALNFTDSAVTSPQSIALNGTGN